MTKRLIHLGLVCSIFFLILAPMGQADNGGGQVPPTRKIPGITAEDMFPGACVDCHINRTEMKMDTRISTLMKQWQDKVEPKLLAKARAFTPGEITLKGKHPTVTGALKDIPASCIKCHRKTSKLVPPFSQMIHGLHLSGREENHFMTLFQGECTHCHKFNTATGELVLPSGPEK